MDLEPLFGRRVLGLLHVPADYAAPKPGLRYVWRRHVVANGYVRDAGYMRALFQSRFPHGTLVEIAPGSLPPELADGEQPLVLLYPDPIGIDFAWAERQLRARWPRRTLLALNGRGRLLRLGPATRAGLALRRNLARFRPLEFGFLVVFLFATPLLWAVDQVRGHR
jgi:hypothetical protein